MSAFRPRAMDLIHSRGGGEGGGGGQEESFIKLAAFSLDAWH